MTDIIEHWLREVHATLRAAPAEKDKIVDELRSHLREKVDELQNADLARPRADVERAVLADFGSPRDLALAYEPSGSAVLTDRAGRVVLDLGRVLGKGAKAVGRGAGTALKWLAIGIAGLLVTAILLGVWAFYEVRPYVETLVEQNAPYPLYSFHCDRQGCTGDPSTQVFYVHPDAREVRIDIDAWHPRESTTNGTIAVTLHDSTGATKLNRTIAVGPRGHFSEESSFAPAPGEWSLSVDFGHDWQGGLQIEVYALGLPKGAIRS